MRANDPNLSCLRQVAEPERAGLVMERLEALSRGKAVACPR